MDTKQRSFVVTTNTAPDAYYEGWAMVILRNDVVKVLRTRRGGSDGRSDSRYLAARLQSGLYVGEHFDNLPSAIAYAQTFANRVPLHEQVES